MFIDTTFVRAATVTINVAIVCSHTPTHDGEGAPTASQIPEPIIITAFAIHPQKSRQGDGTPKLQLSNNIQLYVRVIRMRTILTRVRHRSRNSPRFPLNLCVSHNSAEFFQTTLGLALRLVGLILISVLLCFLHHPINFGLRQLPFSHRYSV